MADFDEAETDEADTRTKGDIDPIQIEIPDIEFFKDNVTKNNESYLENINEEEDTDERCRVCIRIEHCFFGGRKCRTAIWNKAVWTMTKEPRQCLVYAMHHATQSSAHWLSKEKAYEIMKAKFDGINWIVQDDTLKTKTELSRSD